MRNSDAELDRALDALRSRGWSGEDRNARVEHRIKELIMSQNSSGLRMTKRVLIGAIAIAALGGGAVTAGVAHYANQRARITLDTGESFDVELDPNGSGLWIMDDGTQIRLKMAETLDCMNVDVEMTADGDGSATFIVEDETPTSKSAGDSDGDN